MTNTKLLERRIDEKGIKKSYIAKTLGISVRALTMKMKNQTEFKSREIAAICQLLGIGLQDKEAIFFAQFVD